MHRMLVAIPVISILIFLPYDILGQNDVKNTMTMLPWELQDDESLYIIIQAAPSVFSEKVEIVKRAILSENSFTQDGMKLYDGWGGALKMVTNKTKFSMPTKLEIVEGVSTSKVITIILSPLRDESEYSGYTTFITQDHKISKSIITLYDVNNLSNQELLALTRHEFGHALGLGHSTAYGDLMYETIDLRSPFISECDIQALISLYDGKLMSQHFCSFHLTV